MNNVDIRNKILDDIKEAMKSKAQDRLDTLRFLNSAIKNKEINQRPQVLTPENVLEVIKSLVKQRKDSIEQFQKAQRADLVTKEQNELKILESYLPQQMSLQELEPIVDEVLRQVGATSMKQMGDVMKACIAQVGSKADNSLISQVVRTKLQKLSSQ